MAMTMLIEVGELGGARETATNKPDTSNICVGRRLRMGRILAGVSPAELCRKLGIGRDELDAFEHGEKRVGANLLRRIAKALDVRLDYFFHGYSAEEISACLDTSP